MENQQYEELIKILSRIRKSLRFIVGFLVVYAVFAITASSLYGIYYYHLYGSHKETPQKQSGENDVESVLHQLYEQDNYSNLLTVARDELRKNVNNPSAIFYAGVAYYRQKDFKTAIKYFRRAVFLRPDWESSIDPYMKAIIELQDAEIPDAENLIEK